MGSGNSGNLLRTGWQDGIRAAVLARAGFETATGGAEAAADILAEFGWAERTWTNRLAQVRKWLSFCEEDGRQALPAEEGDVLAYIGYLALEGWVGPRSVPQYVSAVSRYHQPRFRLSDAYSQGAGPDGSLHTQS